MSLSVVEKVNSNETQQKQGPLPNNKKYIYIILFTTTSFITLLLSFYWFIYSNSHISTENAFIESNLAPVNSRIMGYVKAVNVEENTSVKKGQILAVFDDTDLNLELKFKKAKLDKAQADYNRSIILKKSLAISSSDFELAKTNLDIQSADHEATLLKLEYTHVISPFDGFVGKKNIQPGQFIQPGQSMFVIISKEKPWIKANYKETQIQKIKPGMEVEIRVDAYPQIKIKGLVESIAPVSGSKLSLLPPENATGNFTKIVQKIPVKISLEKSNPLLIPGMSVTTTVITN